MAKGRHVVRKQKALKKVDSAVADAADLQADPLFIDLGVQHRAASAEHAALASPALSCRQLVVLAFQSKASQHAALARIEAFYESAEQSKEYVTLEEAKSRRLCANYEAFNVPLTAIRQWLQAMKATLDSTPSNTKKADAETVEDSRRTLWSAHCNDEEVQLLAYLDALDCLDTQNEGKVQGDVPIYLVSVLASQLASSLPHEQLHFLYNVSPSYRAAAQEQYDLLLPKTRRIIETDLGMRKYAPHIFVDEFQAYVSLNDGEFGNKTRDECVPIRSHLLKLQRALWAELTADKRSARVEASDEVPGVEDVAVS